MVTFWGGVKKKTVTAAGDNVIEWTLGGTEQIIGFIGANMTTNPVVIAIHLANEPRDWDLRQIYFETAVSDKGVSKLFPRPLTARYVEIWFEDCVIGDELKGRLIFDQ